jgi:hypothetical protein
LLSRADARHLDHDLFPPDIFTGRVIMIDPEFQTRGQFFFLRGK